jgi:non-heme chloroperoxidase
VYRSFVELFGCKRLGAAIFVDQSPLQLQSSDGSWKLGSKTLSDYASLVHLETLLKIQPEAVYQQNVHDCLFREPSKKEIDYFVSLSKEADAEFLAKLIKDHAMADWRPTLPHLQCPCLVIYGEQSKIFPEDAALYLADKLPRKMIQPFKFAGHWPYYEMPERFNDVIHDFIRNRMQQL